VFFIQDKNLIEDLEQKQQKKFNKCNASLVKIGGIKPPAQKNIKTKFAEQKDKN